MGRVSFSDFKRIVIGGDNVFDRPGFDRFTNLIKFLALYFGYFFYRLGVSANLLNIVSIFCSLLLFAFVTGYYDIGILGETAVVFTFYGIIFVDFFDGAIAKATATQTEVGAILDDFNVDLARFVGFYYIANHLNSSAIASLALASALVINFYVPRVVHFVNFKVVLMKRLMELFFTSKFGVTGVRVLCIFMLLVLIFGFFSPVIASQMALMLSILYIIGATLVLGYFYK